MIANPPGRPSGRSPNLRDLRNLRDLKKYLLLIHRMSFSSSYTFRAYRIQSNRAQEGWWQ